MNIAEQLKAIASELSYRGTRAGEIRLGTKDRAEPLRQELVRLYNMERKPADNGQVAETPRGVLLRSAITHLMAAVYGAGTHTPADHEAAIVRAAGELNMMAEQLQALDDHQSNNPWKQARDADSKVTIADQMLLLFKRDDSIVDRKNLSGEVAKILDCSSQAVRHKDNASWIYYQAERDRRKEVRQALKGKHSSQFRNGKMLAKSDDEDADD